MKHLNKIWALVFALFIPALLSAQNQLVEGEIILNNEDTIKGFIKYRNWNLNPSSIYFSRSQDGELERYLPKQLKAFKIIGREIYESHIVSIDQTTDNLNNLSKNPAPAPLIDTVFLRLRVKGEISLYSLKDINTGSHYYIRKGDSAIEELISQKYLITNQSSYLADKTTKVGTDKRFRSQLRNAFSNCNQLHHKIQQAELKEKQLHSLISDYNTQCATNKEQLIAPAEKAKLEIGGVVGVSWANLDFNGKAFKELSSANFNTTTYTAGLSFNVVFPRSFQRWSLYNDIRYKPYSFKGAFTDLNNEEYYTQHDISFKTNFLSMTNTIRHTFNFLPVKPFLNLGIINSLVINEKSKNVVYSRRYTSEYTEVKEDFYDYPLYQIGLAGGIGLIWNNLSTEIRCELGNRHTKYEFSNTRLNSVNFLIAYTLK